MRSVKMISAEKVCREIKRTRDESQSNELEGEAKEIFAEYYIFLFL